jgi:hypothetical protein
MSVLLDGFYIETANVAIDNLPPAEHGLAFCIVNSSEASDVIQQHAASLAQTAAARGSQPAVLKPEDLQGVVNYGRQLSLHSLVEQGVLTELPEFLRKQR